MSRPIKFIHYIRTEDKEEIWELEDEMNEQNSCSAKTNLNHRLRRVVAYALSLLVAIIVSCIANGIYDACR